MATIMSDEPPTPKNETFMLETETSTVLFTGGTKWSYGFDGERPAAAQLTPESVIRIVVTYMLGTEASVTGYRAVSATYKPDGINYCVLGGNFDPVSEPTWECWVWMVEPEGIDFFPDYSTVYVRDGDGKPWTLEWRDSKRTRRVPSYQKEASPWHGKPRSQRKKKA